MSYKSILSHIDGDSRVATLTLNRPDKLNSFTRAMHRELSARARPKSKRASARALVLTGAGRGFCAGQDLADLDFTPGAMTDLGDLIDEHFNPLIRRLQALPLPVIAAVNGTAAGAGANLALACDLVLAARSASFIQAFVKIGLVPDSGGTWFLPRRVGDGARARARDHGRQTQRGESRKLGPRSGKSSTTQELQPTAAQLAAQLAQQPTPARSPRSSTPCARARRKRSTSNSISNATATRPRRIARLRRRRAAFMEKRAPRFEGR